MECKSTPPPLVLMKRVILGALLVLLFALSIPGLESLRFRIPAYHELMRSEGVAFFEWSKEYKRGLPIGIRTETGVMFITCRITSSDSADCIARKDRAILDGQPVTVLWIERPIFLWKTEKRVFQIEVNGRVLLAYDEMVSRYRQRLPDWFGLGISAVALAVLIFVAAYLAACKPKTRSE